MKRLIVATDQCTLGVMENGRSHMEIKFTAIDCQLKLVRIIVDIGLE